MMTLFALFFFLVLTLSFASSSPTPPSPYVYSRSTWNAPPARLRYWGDTSNMRLPSVESAVTAYPTNRLTALAGKRIAKACGTRLNSYAVTMDGLLFGLGNPTYHPGITVDSSDFSLIDTSVTIGEPLIDLFCSQHSMILLTESGNLYGMGQNSYYVLKTDTVTVPDLIDLSPGVPVDNVLSLGNHLIISLKDGRTFLRGNCYYGSCCDGVSSLHQVGWTEVEGVRAYQATSGKYATAFVGLNESGIASMYFCGGEGHLPVVTGGGGGYVTSPTQVSLGPNVAVEETVVAVSYSSDQGVYLTNENLYVSRPTGSPLSVLAASHTNPPVKATKLSTLSPSSIMRLSSSLSAENVLAHFFQTIDSRVFGVSIPGLNSGVGSGSDVLTAQLLSSDLLTLPVCHSGGCLAASIVTCSLIPESDPTVCSSHGECVARNNCSCDDSYGGQYCDEWSCGGVLQTMTDDVCGGQTRGACVDFDSCDCLNGWMAPYCQVCDLEHWTGLRCDVCHPDWTGEGCATRLRGAEIESNEVLMTSLIVLVIMALVLVSIVVCCVIGFAVIRIVKCLRRMKRQAAKFQEFEEEIHFVELEARTEEKQGDGQQQQQHQLRINKALFEIDWKDLDLVKQIGRGSFGVVYLAHWNRDSDNVEGTKKKKRRRQGQINRKKIRERVAVKVFRIRDVATGDGGSMESFEREVRVMSRLEHPNVIAYSPLSSRVFNPSTPPTAPDTTSPPVRTVIIGDLPVTPLQIDLGPDGGGRESLVIVPEELDSTQIRSKASDGEREQIMTSHEAMRKQIIEHTQSHETQLEKLVERVAEEAKKTAEIYRHDVIQRSEEDLSQSSSDQVRVRLQNVELSSERFQRLGQYEREWMSRIRGAQSELGRWLKDADGRREDLIQEEKGVRDRMREDIRMLVENFPRNFTFVGGTRQGLGLGQEGQEVENRDVEEMMNVQGRILLPEEREDNHEVEKQEMVVDVDDDVEEEEEEGEEEEEEEEIEVVLPEPIVIRKSPSPKPPNLSTPGGIRTDSALRFLNHYLLLQDHSLTPLRSLSDISPGTLIFPILQSLVTRLLDWTETDVISKLLHPQPRNVAEMRENWTVALGWLKSIKIPLHGIHAASIVRKEVRVIEGLVWALVRGMLWCSEEYHGEDEGPKGMRGQVSVPDPYASAISFANSIVPPPTGRRRVITAPEDWSSGQVLASLIDAIYDGPKQTPWSGGLRDVTPRDELVAQCLTFAEDAMDVAPVVSVEAVVGAEKKSLGLYVCLLRCYDRTQMMGDDDDEEEEEEEDAYDEVGDF